MCTTWCTQHAAAAHVTNVTPVKGSVCPAGKAGGVSVPGSTKADYTGAEWTLCQDCEEGTFPSDADGNVITAGASQCESCDAGAATQVVRCRTCCHRLLHHVTLVTHPMLWCVPHAAVAHVTHVTPVKGSTCLAGIPTCESCDAGTATQVMRCRTFCHRLLHHVQVYSEISLFFFSYSHVRSTLSCSFTLLPTCFLGASHLRGADMCAPDGPSVISASQTHMYTRVQHGVPPHVATAHVTHVTPVKGSDCPAGKAGGGGTKGCQDCREGTFASFANMRDTLTGATQCESCDAGTATQVVRCITFCRRL